MSTETVDADACGALGCTETEGLQEVTTGARTRVVCGFHAQALRGDQHD
jgi:hypothetical protein